MTDGFPDTGRVDTCLCSEFLIQEFHWFSCVQHALDQMKRYLCGLLNTMDGSICKGIQSGKLDAENATPTAVLRAYLNEAADILIEDSLV